MEKICLCAMGAFRKADSFLTRHRLVFGALLAAALAGVLALYNVSSGPLHNLNDIGGWSNRALFIGMTAIVHALVLMLCAAVSRCCFARLALRQAILTAGYYILQLGINHKTYMFSEVILPAIRALQEGGVAAALSMDTGLSAYALMLIRDLSATPVYPMYMLKLMSMAALMSSAVLAMHAAEKNGLGLRAETLLALCLILPQGFMNAACTALIDVTAAALLLGGFALLDCRKPYGKYMAAALMAVACALSGVCLYALPLAMLMMKKRSVNMGLLLVVPAVMTAFGALAVFSGAPVLDVMMSYSPFSAARYACGSPGLMSLVPRALVEEMPQYAPVLSHFETLDTVTHAQPYYTQAHFEQLSAGFVWASAAVFMGMSMLAYRAEDKTVLHRVMIFVLGALMACPGATAGAWILLDVLCLYAIFAQPKLRVPACMVLFATMCSATYPMTEEVMLPMIYAFALCLGALLMLLDVIPMGKENADE